MADRTFGPQNARFDGGLGNVNPDDLARELNRIPLFMTELPEEDNDVMAALQSLIYDGPAEGMLIRSESQCISLGTSDMLVPFSFLSFFFASLKHYLRSILHLQKLPRISRIREMKHSSLVLSTTKMR